MTTLKKFSSEKELIKYIEYGLTIIIIVKENSPSCEETLQLLKKFSQNHLTTKFAVINEKKIQELKEEISPISYPTLVLAKNGNILDTFYGNIQEENIKKFINSATNT